MEVNCKMFGDASDVNISVSWAIDSTNDIIVIQICGCVLVSISCVTEYDTSDLQ